MKKSKLIPGQDDDGADVDGRESGDDGGDDVQGDGSEGGDGRSYTDADLQRVGAKESRRGAAKALRDLADELGVPIDEVRQIVKARKEAEEAERTELDREREAARSAAADRDKLARDLEAERLRNRLVPALLKRDGDNPGCDPEVVDTVADMALAEALRSDDDDPVAAAVAAVRVKLPHVFVESGIGGSGAGDDGSSGPATGGGRPLGQKRSQRQRPLTPRQKGREALDRLASSRGYDGVRPLWQQADQD